MKKTFTSRENNSFHLVHEIIEAEFRETFRLRMTSHELKKHQSKVTHNGK